MSHLLELGDNTSDIIACISYRVSFNNLNRRNNKKIKMWKDVDEEF